MELHQLRYVVAVARTGNFTRAAEECHVSQPSLSQQIRKLEEELGERLFDRLRRRTRPTPAGAAFLRRAGRILAEVDAARREAVETRGRLRGTVSLGVLPTIAPYLLPAVLTAFTARHPEVEVVALEETTARLQQLALAGEVDLALVSPPIRDEHFAVEALFEEDLLLAVPPGHRLARQPAVAAAELAQERLIVMQEGHCLGDQVLGFCDLRGVQPAIRFRSAQLETIQALVAAGLGVSLIPAMAVRAERAGGPACRPFRGVRPRRQLAVLWPRQRPPGRAAKALLQLLHTWRPPGPGPDAASKRPALST